MLISLKFKLIISGSISVNITVWILLWTLIGRCGGEGGGGVAEIILMGYKNLFSPVTYAPPTRYLMYVLLQRIT